MTITFDLQCPCGKDLELSLTGQQLLLFYAGFIKIPELQQLQKGDCICASLAQQSGLFKS